VRVIFEVVMRDVGEEEAVSWGGIGCGEGGEGGLEDCGVGGGEDAEVLGGAVVVEMYEGVCRWGCREWEGAVGEEDGWKWK